jgi:hypothetical protein
MNTRLLVKLLANENVTVVKNDEIDFAPGHRCTIQAETLELMLNNDAHFELIDDQIGLVWNGKTYIFDDSDLRAIINLF